MSKFDRSDILSMQNTDCRRCYCDDAPQNYGGPAPDGSTGCNMPCQGDNTEKCGGPGRLNVYQFNSSALPAQPSGPAKPGNVNETAILPFTYQGCYTDDMQGGRALSNQQPDNNTLTIESCVAMCTAAGYNIAGAEYATQCFCDNYLHNSPKLVNDRECNMNCAGSSGEKCGAGGRLSMYSNGTMGNFSTPSAQQDGIPGNWTYQGCYSDIDGARTLEYKMVNPTNNSNANCLSLCAAYGYNAGGTEYGEECYCGDIAGVTASGATKQPESDCNMLCTNDKGKNGGYICGGPSRLSYYTWTGDPLYNWDFASGNNAGKYEFFISGPVIPLITTPSRNGKITFLEKFGTSPANNGTGAYEMDYSLVGKASASYSDVWREMHVKTDVFCAASLTLPDRAGRQIDVGGWSGDSTFGVRLYWPDGKPGVHGQNDWQENQFEVSLLNGRWYPSAMTMANGSILVMGGEDGSNGAPVPTLEVLPSPSGEVARIQTICILSLLCSHLVASSWPTTMKPESSTQSACRLSERCPTYRGPSTTTQEVARILTRVLLWSFLSMHHTVSLLSSSSAAEACLSPRLLSITASRSHLTCPTRIGPLSACHRSVSCRTSSRCPMAHT
jgi:hypothetical protein